MEDNKRNVFTNEDYARSDLLINPFAYKSDEHIVESIEDFAIQVKLGLFKKRETVYIRSLVRNDLISKSKRFSIFKDYLKTQKKDFDNSLNNDKKENIKNKKSFSSIEFKKVSIGKFFISFIILCVSIFLTSLFFESIVSKFNLVFLNDMYAHIENKMASYKLYIVSGVVLVNLFALWFFVYLIVFKISNEKYAKMQKRKYREMEKYIVNVNKAKDKCYKRVLKYYKQNIYQDSKSYEALVLNELWDLKPNIDEKDIELEDKARNNKKIVRRNKKYDKKCKFFISVCFLLILILLAFEIINIFI